MYVNVSFGAQCIQTGPTLGDLEPQGSVSAPNSQVLAPGLVALRLAAAPRGAAGAEGRGQGEVQAEPQPEAQVESL